MFPSRDSKPGPSEYEGVLTIKPRLSVSPCLYPLHRHRERNRVVSTAKCTHLPYRCSSVEARWLMRSIRSPKFTVTDETLAGDCCFHYLRPTSQECGLSSLSPVLLWLPHHHNHHHLQHLSTVNVSSNEDASDSNSRPFIFISSSFTYSLHKVHKIKPLQGGRVCPSVRPPAFSSS
jgi:hypothetical protein